MSDRTPGSRAQWEERYWVSADGLRLHYRDYAGRADRPPLLCLHGLTRNGRDFEGLAERLGGQWRLIVPDFRGRGLSEWDAVPERYSPPTYTADIIGLLDQLDIEKAAFIGTSLGGLVTMGIAAISPDRIAGAVLNDIGPHLEVQGLDRIRSYVGRPVHFASWDAAAAALAAQNKAIHPVYRGADWLRMARRMCRELGHGISFDYDMAVAQNVLASASAPQVDAWPFFRALSVAPLLILRGELSDLLSAETALRMADQLPDAELVVVPNVGHAPDLQEEAASRGIDRLLAKVARGSAQVKN